LTQHAGPRPGCSIALADERRSATAYVLSAADENTQKSKLSGRKTNAKIVAIR
jgi:hypothetical protein